MKINKNPTFICEFCGKIYIKKGWCVKHEKKCRKNPKNIQICLTGCIHIENKKIEYISGNPHETGQSSTDGFFCAKKNIYLYPFWSNSPISRDDIIDEIPNEPMPKKCDMFSL